MATPSPGNLQSLIEWDFALTSDIGTTRYGQYAGAYWKQYLPAGIAIPAKHPPKRIEPRFYERAKKHSIALE